METKDNTQHSFFPLKNRLNLFKNLNSLSSHRHLIITLIYCIKIVHVSFKVN